MPRVGRQPADVEAARALDQAQLAAGGEATLERAGPGGRVLAGVAVAERRLLEQAGDEEHAAVLGVVRGQAVVGVERAGPGRVVAAELAAERAEHAIGGAGEIVAI